MPGATIFHLVRHAEHALLGRVLAGRMPGVGLSEVGQAQAERLSWRFSHRSVAAVVASPMQRAQETANPIAAGAGLGVQTDAGLNEIDFGAWTGIAFDALQPLPAWRAWNAYRSVASSPGGETMLAAQARAVAALLRLRGLYPDREIVVVSHADVLKSVLAHFLGLSVDLMQRIELDPASCSTVLLFDADVRVASVNLPA